MNKADIVVGDVYTTTDNKIARAWSTWKKIRLYEGEVFECIKKDGKYPIYKMKDGVAITFTNHWSIEPVVSRDGKGLYQVTKEKVELYRELLRQESEKLNRLNSQRVQKEHFKTEKEYEDWMIKEIIKHEGNVEIIGKIIRGEWVVDQFKQKRKV